MSQEQNIVSFSGKFTNAQQYVKEMIDFVRKNVRSSDKILIAVSGGVDSTVVAKLAHKAVPNLVVPIFIDTGYMRLIKGVKESELLAKALRDIPNFKVLDESEMFFKNTFNIKDANKKRLAFRQTYDFILNREAKELDCSVHMDGTIKPDIIETKQGVKPQSNVDNVFLFEKKIEILASLYKHQVRKCAEIVGLTEELAFRQPFPGPGLSVRVVEEINKDKLETERVANDIVEEGIDQYFIQKYGKNYLYDDVIGERIPFQNFAVTLDSSTTTEFSDIEREIEKRLKSLIRKNVRVEILANKATGMKVTGEKLERVYSNIISLEIEGMVDPLLLKHIGEVLPEEYGFSRVLLKILPGKGKYSVAIRNVKSKNALNAEPLIGLPVYMEIAKKIKNRCLNVGSVLEDITPKPPATIEFE